MILQGCSSPIVVKFADTQKDKEQKRIAQQLQQQMQQISAASVWGNLAGLNTLGPQYLAVSFLDNFVQHCIQSGLPTVKVIVQLPSYFNFSVKFLVYYYHSS